MCFIYKIIYFFVCWIFLLLIVEKLYLLFKMGDVVSVVMVEKLIVYVDWLFIVLVGEGLFNGLESVVLVMIIVLIINLFIICVVLSNCHLLLLPFLLITHIPTLFPIPQRVIIQLLTCPFICLFYISITPWYFTFTRL